ncbi:hypothetical protein [Hydrotalea sp.]|uniref:hypothetical protein n=1 Tax=Hydrotalea sp. TaxID=2881279 RepID=UPI003D126FDD
MVRFLLIIISVVLLLACAQQKKQPTSNEVILMPIYQMDSIFHLFGNNNWRVIKGRDTSYLYFSRQNDLLIHVYDFKMQQGDSVQSALQKIVCTPKGIFWEKYLDTFRLISASHKEVLWLNNVDTLVYNVSINHVLQQRNKSILSIMQPTINLTDFLIRSHYDYLHGTNYANDTSKFKRSLKK